MKRVLAVLGVWLCAALGAGAQGEVSFQQKSGQVEVLLDGKPFTTLHYGGDWAKPFLQPLRLPSGLAVTRGFPLEKVAGETSDHPHHRGIWYSHGDINGIDFWLEPNPERPMPMKRYGKIVPRGTPSLKAGKNGGTLTADFDLQPSTGDPIGALREAYTFRRDGDSAVIDASITLLANRGVALKMGDTEEGAFGVRLADAFRQDRGAVLSNSDGLVRTEKIWGKRARWVDYSTTLKGEPIGVTIIDHPRNPKHPTYWHARGYGLCAANPFGEHDFHMDSARNGSVTIAAGGELTFRYRVVLHPGMLDRAVAERQAEQFAR
jgi:hypothetical protein